MALFNNHDKTLQTILARLASIESKLDGLTAHEGDVGEAVDNDVYYFADPNGAIFGDTANMPMTLALKMFMDTHLHAYESRIFRTPCANMDEFLKMLEKTIATKFSDT